MKYLLILLLFLSSCDIKDGSAINISTFKVEDVDSPIDLGCDKQGYVHFHRDDSRYEYGDVVLCDGHLCRVIKTY